MKGYSVQVGNMHYLGEKDLPKTARLFPLEGALLLPGSIIPLNIFEPRYLELFDDAMASDRIVALIQPSFLPEKVSPVPDLCKVGTLARIVSHAESGDGRYMVSLGGICRFRLKAEHEAKSPYRVADICSFIGDLEEDVAQPDQFRDVLFKHFNAYVEENDIEVDFEDIQQLRASDLVNLLSSLIPFDVAEKQALLEADLDARVQTLIALIEMNSVGNTGEGGQLVQ